MCRSFNEHCYVVAWYDYELKGYQNDRQNHELDRYLEERIDSKHSVMHESKFGEYMARPVVKDEEVEWQRIAREKASGDKIKEVRNEIIKNSIFLLKIDGNIIFLNFRMLFQAIYNVITLNCG